MNVSFFCTEYREFIKVTVQLESNFHLKVNISVFYQMDSVNL